MDADGGEVAVPGLDAVGVTDADEVAVAAVPAGEADNSVGYREGGRAGRYGEVLPGVEVGPPVVGETRGPQPEVNVYERATGSRQGPDANGAQPAVLPASRWTRSVARASCASYANGKPDRCTDCAACQSGIFCQPLTDSRPEFPVGEVGPP